jgi:hypothetical protein
MIFDASAAGWAKIDHPALAVAADGNLFVTFEQGSLVDIMPGSGIFSIHTKGPISALPQTSVTAQPTAAGGSSEHLKVGENWSEPVEVAPAGSDWSRLVILQNALHLFYMSENGLAHRQIDLAKIDGALWEGAERVPGWQNMVAEQTLLLPERVPYSIVADSQTIHLLSTVPFTAGLRYSAWKMSDGDTAGRWSQVEEFTPLGRWQNLPGIAAHIQAEVGMLAAAWQAMPEEAIQGTPAPALPVIYLSIRQVPVVIAPPVQAAAPTATINSVTPTAEVLATPTPTLLIDMQKPGPEEGGLPPLVLGAGLAAIIVVAIFAGILLRSRR